MHKYLIILPNNLGDVITSIPVLEGLKKKDQTSEITFLVENGFEAGIECNPYCDRLIRFDREKTREYIRSEWQNGIKYLGEFIQKLKQESFYTIINLSQNTYISYIVTLLKGTEKKGMQFLPEGNFAVNDEWSLYLYAVPYARQFNCLHVTDVYKRIAGVQSCAAEGHITLRKNEIKKAKKFIEEITVNSTSRKVVFQCGAAWKVKQWPPEYFVILGRKLVRDGYFILITGAPQEFESAKKIQEGIGENSAVTTGKLSFRETIALLLFTDCCITADTALMHAASALNRKVIALFGPTSPIETGPYGSGHTVLAGKCSDRPCFNKNCSSNRCLKGIFPETVYSCFHNRFPENSGCDIFKTELSDGIYKLIPAVSKTEQYYNEAGSVVARKLLEPWIPVSFDDTFKQIRNKAKIYTKEIRKMEKELVEYLSDNDISHIQQYEKIHRELSLSDGITAFWNAILNLKLNSIPVLKPLTGIKESINILEKTASQITQSVENEMQAVPR